LRYNSSIRIMSLKYFLKTLFALCSNTALALVIFISQPQLFASSEGVCARVKIEIEQELTLERQAFEARLTVNNGLPATSLTDFQVELVFQDKDRQTHANMATINPSANKDTFNFFYRMADGMAAAGGILGADGKTEKIVINQGSSKKLEWLIIPSIIAGGQNPKGTMYFVGATITYKVDGVEEKREIEPDYIYVKPMPKLKLAYFLPEQVFGDDPNTLIYEPEEPFTLGIRVANNGAGPAKALKIESAQPRIVVNNQGLLANFAIIGSEVNGLPVQPTLTVDFGDLLAQRVGIGRWKMTSSLTGAFTEFTASFTHADELGGQITSLLESIDTYELVGDVRVDLPGRDKVKDFLAKPRGASSGYQLFESDRLDTVNVPKLSSHMSYQSNAYLLSMDESPNAYESFYTKIDVGVGLAGQAVVRVLRADGKVLDSNNVWLSKTKNGTVYNYYLNLFDTHNTANYSYYIQFDTPPVANRPPVIGPLGEKFLKTQELYAFRVSATDADSADPITIDAPDRPTGATLVPKLNAGVPIKGESIFSWTPLASQIGEYNVSIRASDGKATTRKNVKLIVTGGAKYDAWKNRYWPLITDINVTGDNADPDGDGFNNLVEYALGLNPTQSDTSPFDVDIVEYGGNSYLALTYTRRNDDQSRNASNQLIDNLTFTVYGGNSLLTGQAMNPQTNTITVDQVGVPDGFEKIKVRDSEPLSSISQDRRFLRLTVGLTGTSIVSNTPPVMGMRVDLPAKQNSLVSTPVLRKPVFMGRIKEVESGALVVAGAQWATDIYKPGATGSYYAEFVSGDFTGVVLPITSNTSNKLVVNNSGNSLVSSTHSLGAIKTDIYNSTTLQLTQQGDRIVIRPAWDVGKLFGRNDSEVILQKFVSQVEAENLTAGDRILIPNRSLLGFEQMPENELFYVQSQGWRQKGNATGDASGYPLEAGNLWVVSRNAVDDLKLLIPGEVPVNRIATWVPGSSATVGSEVLLSSRLAEPIDLLNSGLWNVNVSKSPMRASASLTARRDELSFFSRLDGDFGWEPSERWVIIGNGNWQEVGNLSQSLLEPGAGFRLRLDTSHDGAWWIQTPNY
jgi:uncharacterized protein (TIGR02597 family)